MVHIDAKKLNVDEPTNIFQKQENIMENSQVENHLQLNKSPAVNRRKTHVIVLFSTFFCQIVLCSLSAEFSPKSIFECLIFLSKHTRRDVILKLF